MLDFTSETVDSKLPTLELAPAKIERCKAWSTKTREKTIKLSLSLAADIQKMIAELSKHCLEKGGFPTFPECKPVYNPTKDYMGKSRIPFQTKVSGASCRSKWIGPCTWHLLDEDSELASMFLRIVRGEQVYTKKGPYKMTCTCEKSESKNIWIFDFRGNLYVEFPEKEQNGVMVKDFMSYEAKDIYTVLTSLEGSTDPIIAARPEFSAETHATVWLNDTMVMVYRKDCELARDDLVFFAENVSPLFEADGLPSDCYCSRSAEGQAFLIACHSNAKNIVKTFKAPGYSPPAPRKNAKRFEPETAGESSTTPLVAPATKAAKRKPHKGKRNAGHPEE